MEVMGRMKFFHSIFQNIHKIGKKSINQPPQNRERSQLCPGEKNCMAKSHLDGGDGPDEVLAEHVQHIYIVGFRL
jgi:hypothetical protein